LPQRTANVRSGSLADKPFRAKIDGCPLLSKSGHWPLRLAVQIEEALARRHSESTANLLMRNGANFDIFSECALILLANWSDFDSAIRRFDPSRPSQFNYLIVLKFSASRVFASVSF
jgi:hypothetical protein